MEFGAAIPEELPCTLYASNFWNVKNGKTTFGLDLKQHCASKNYLQRWQESSHFEYWTDGSQTEN